MVTITGFRPSAMALDPCLPEIFAIGGWVEESESGPSESAGTHDAHDPPDEERAGVGVELATTERAVAIDMQSEILAASLANEPERITTAPALDIRQSIAPSCLESMLWSSRSSSHIHEDTAVDVFISCALWSLFLVLVLVVLTTGVARGVILRGGLRGDGIGDDENADGGADDDGMT